MPAGDRVANNQDVSIGASPTLNLENCTGYPVQLRYTLQVGILTREPSF